MVKVAKLGILYLIVQPAKSSHYCFIIWTWLTIITFDVEITEKNLIVYSEDRHKLQISIRLMTNLG